MRGCKGGAVYLRGEFIRCNGHDMAELQPSPSVDVAFKKRPQETAVTSSGEIPNAERAGRRSEEKRANHTLHALVAGHAKCAHCACEAHEELSVVSEDVHHTRMAS